MADHIDKGIDPIFRVDLQPLVNRLAELADLGTLLLLFMIFILLYLYVSERQRNSRAYSHQLRQAVDVVKVMTSHQHLVQNIERALDANANAVRILHERMMELAHRDERPRARSTRRTTAPKKKETE